MKFNWIGSPTGRPIVDSLSIGVKIIIGLIILLFHSSSDVLAQLFKSQIPHHCIQRQCLFADKLRKATLCH